MLHASVDDLLGRVGLAPLGDVRLEVHGRDPVLASPFPVGEAAAIALGAVGAAAGQLWLDRTGVAQTVTVDVRRAAAAIHAHRIQTLDGHPVDNILWPKITGYFRCADGRWVLLCSPLPHLVNGTLSVLGCANDDAEIAAAVARWQSYELEDALASAQVPGAVARTAEEWAVHPQGIALSPFGAISVERVGDAPPEPFGTDDGPVGGVRVLDLTRILAGPVHGRQLADLGADVLLVNSPNLLNIEDSLVETGHGKRSALLDLDDARDASTLRALVADADVFCDGYRGGALEQRGFGAADLAALRPGIITVGVSCYGDVGPWRARHGFEPIAHAATGVAVAVGGSGEPGHLPGTVCDYITGCLAAVGTMAALRRRADEGGSYRVRVSLAQTAMWLYAMGEQCDPLAAPGLGDLDAFMVTDHTAFGELTHLRPPMEMSVTPPHWRRTAVPPGTDPAAWW